MEKSMNAVVERANPNLSTVAHDSVFGGRRDPSYGAPKELSHVSIQHRGPGIDKLIRFYQTVLNMRLVYRYVYPAFEFIALSYDDENHRIGIVNQLGPEGDSNMNVEKPITRMEHTSWLYSSFEDLLLTVERVRAELGMWPRTARHQGNGITIDYIDPDGNRVELIFEARNRAEILWGFHQELAAQDGSERRKYMTTYLGFNMEKMVKLWHDGVAVKQLLDKDYCQKLITEGSL
jgi:catechol 2,3-dioxygenase-like lactoylglutathione lyase family enzyme